jgi:very-short-patch-repair endonuclease
MSEFHPILPDKFLYRGRALRRDGTHPERQLWQCLRGGRLCGLKFRRQHAIGPFIVDFYCHAQRLAIELDGESHNGRGRYDLDREEYLRSQDVRVIRFSNDDVLRDLESVLRGILVACGIDPITGTPLPLPLGEGRGEGGQNAGRPDSTSTRDACP